MIQLFKSEFIKRLKELKVYFIIFTVILVVSQLMPTNVPIRAVTWCSVGGGFLYSILYIYLIVITSYDLRKPFILQDNKVAYKPWAFIGIKLLNNVIFMSLDYGFTVVLAIILKRYKTDKIYLSMNTNYVQFILVGLVLSLLILFFYLMAKSLPFVKNYPVLTTIFLVFGVVKLASVIMNNTALSESTPTIVNMRSIFCLVLSFLLLYLCNIFFEKCYVMDKKITK